MRRQARILVLALIGAAALSGCAHVQEPPGKPIEERPRPPQPPTEPPQTSVPDTGAQTQTPPPSMTPSGQESMRSVVVSDTMAVSKALARCAGKNLLPEQETTYDATLKLLADARDALLRGDVSHARSIARNAKQLVGSLDCQ